MLALLLLLVGPALSAEDDASLPNYRLPGDIIPHLYRLSVLTDLNEFSFSGSVDIEVECKEATDTIKLHSNALTIQKEEIAVKKMSDKSSLNVVSINMETNHDFLVIKVSETLTPMEKYILHIPFSSELSRSLSGYYRSSYWDTSTNTTKWMAVTQFAAFHARTAFPCFDEPALKARFRISLGHRPGLTAVSNMPLHSSYSEGGWTWDEFEESVPMSTYLVAYMITEISSVQSEVEDNGVQFTVWARKEVIDQTEFARKYGPKFLVFYEQFFGIDYPLPKQDMVAVPDFGAGAMENWGLITYREAQFLVDKQMTSMDTFYTTASTVAHELAHQWFGNLVTMKWWTDLWLNEGFATFIASIAIREQFPEWNSYKFDVVTNLLSTFSLDSLKSSHPVSVTIEHPSEVNYIFDAISYKKGAYLLHMMSTFLGDEILRSGLSKYLKKFAYGNSEQDDLWEVLTEEAQGADVLPPGDYTVKDVMDSWTLQTGYPVVNVIREGGNVTLSQRRFFAGSQEQTEERWWIPVHYTSANAHPNGASGLQWMSSEDSVVTFDTGAGSDDWIILNNKVSGLYRVNYDEHSWSLLAEALNSDQLTKIDELSRFQLVADAMALAHVEELDYTSAMGILKYIRKEDAYTPWRAASKALTQLENVLWRTKKFVEFKKLVRHLLTDIERKFHDLSQEPATMEGVRHHSLVAYWACKYQVGSCTENAVKLFRLWAKGGKNPIPKDLRYTVLCEGIRQGGDKEWMFVWQKYLSSDVANEKNMFLNTLACSRNQGLLYKLLERTIEPSSGIRSQDVRLVHSSVSRNSQLGFKVALKFLEINIQQINDYFKGPEMVSYLVKILSEKLVTTQEINQMKKFIEDQSEILDTSNYSIKQGLETAESNLAWMRAFYRNISAALKI